MTGVYLIIGPSGKVYVGQAADIPARWRGHRNDLRKSRNRNPKLQRAWNKYGESEFRFSTLLICSESDLNFYEQRAIDYLRAVQDGYNIAPIAGSTRGVKSPAVAERMRKLRGENHPSFGKPRPDLAARNRLISPVKGKKWPADRSRLHLRGGPTHHNYGRKRGPQPPRPLKLAAYVEAIELRLASGENTTMLSREFRVNWKTIDRIRRKANLPPSEGNKGPRSPERCAQIRAARVARPRKTKQPEAKQ